MARILVLDDDPRIRLLRRLSRDVPILAISCAGARIAGLSNLDAARKLGADDSLAKPFGLGELKQAVASLLGAKTA